jgi:hypothetical protein
VAPNSYYNEETDMSYPKIGTVVVDKLGSYLQVASKSHPEFIDVRGKGGISAFLTRTEYSKCLVLSGENSRLVQEGGYFLDTSKRPAVYTVDLNGTGAPSSTGVGKAGVKDDKEKPDVGLVITGFPRALLAISGISTFGAAKYSRGGWRTVPNGVERYTAALGRHLLAESIDPSGMDAETEGYHMTQTAWNAIARLELFLTQEEKNLAEVEAYNGAH